MQHRVETLRLAVHSSPGREAAAARLAEHFTRDVLEQFSEIVEARSPGRVVLIRRMALRWSLSEAQLADKANVASSAAELADSVAASDGGLPHAGDSIAAFDDEAGWLAAYLRQRALGAGEEWFHATWRDAERHGTALASPLRRDIVLAALSRLDAAGELAGVLARLPPATIASLGAALGIDGAAALSLEPTIAAPVAVAAAGSVLAGLVPPLAPSAAGDPKGVEAALLEAVAAVAQPSEERLHEPVVPGPLTFAEPDEQAAPATRFGGLFYLLSLALELGIGEALWKVCLPEGLILAQAAAALLGPDAAGDPAPAWFGGVAPRELLTWPPVSPEQQAEACTELLAATATALPRYGVAPSPEVLLDLMPSPAGRLLVASGQGPFALFAWPAPDASAVAAGLAAFLGAWPGSFPPPRAPGVLVDLDTSGRLRPNATERRNKGDSGRLHPDTSRQPHGARAGVSEPTVGAAPLLPFTPTAPASALLAQICGTLAELFALRVGLTPAEASEVVARYLAIPAQVEWRPEAMTVVLPMARIDLAVRRAALDRNAGWVPWLGRTVRLEFVSEGGDDVV
jgi:hypothetical protein